MQDKAVLTDSVITESIQLLESDSGADGDVWGVRIITEGMNVSKTRSYTRQSLEDITNLMKAPPLQCFVDHPTRTDARDREERSIKELLGWYTDPRIEGNSVVAKLHLLNSGPAAPITAMIKEAAIRGNMNLVGLSIKGIGENEMKRDGHIYEIVHSIKDLMSADAVTRPGAGGRLINVAESENEELRRHFMELENMTIDDLKAARPDLVALIEKEHGPKDDEYEYEPPKDKKKKMMKGEEVHKGEDKDEDDDEYEPPEGKKKMKREEKETMESDVLEVNLEETISNARAMLEEARQAKDEIQKVQLGLLLDAELSKSTLPEPMKADIRKRFSGNLFTYEDLKESISHASSMWDELMGAPRTYTAGSQVKINVDEKEHVAGRLDATWYGEDLNGYRPYSGLKEAYFSWKAVTDPSVLYNPYTFNSGDAQKILQEGRRYMAASTEARTIKQSLQESVGLSTSWSTVLGDSTHRVMLKFFDEAGYDDWEKIVTQVHIAKDIKTIQFTQRGGYVVTPSVLEGGTYQERTFPAEVNPTLAFTKYGDLQPLTIEAIINDDLDALQRIPKELGFSAKFLVYKTVMDLLANNSNYGPDSTALAHTDHGNTGTTAMSAAELATAIMDLRDNTNAGSTDRPLVTMPKYLIVPLELDDLAWRLVTSMVRIVPEADNRAGGASTEPNLFRAKYGMEHMVVDYWTDANNWWVVADPKKIETLRAAFHPARQPEFYVQDDPTAGSAFTADKITYKTRFWFGVTISEYRGFWGGIVT